MKDEKIYTVREVADRLRCSIQHVHTLMESGRLEAFNIAADTNRRASWRIKEKSLALLINHA